MRDYSRQTLFDQQKLHTSAVAVIGSGPLSQHFCTYAAGLGIGTLYLLDGEDPLAFSYGNQTLAEYVTALNTDLRVIPTKRYPSCDAYVHLASSVESKAHARHAAQAKHIPFFLSATSEGDSGSIDVRSLQKGRLEQLLRPSSSSRLYHLLCPETAVSQGHLSSGVLAAIALEEVRKSLLPLPDESPLVHRLQYQLQLPSRFCFGPLLPSSHKEKERAPAKILVAGAGGIGTYACLHLGLMGVRQLDIADADRIEGHNLNRQVFYHDRIGENKADVLCERLRQFCPSTQFISLPRMVDEKTPLGGYDLVLGCVDSWQARFLLHEKCKAAHVPFLTASVTAFSAKVEVDNCYPCKHNKTELLALEKESTTRGCSHVPETNVVMMNGLAGALLAGEAEAFFTPSSLRTRELRYFSRNIDSRKFGILEPRHYAACAGCGCDCHA